MLALLSVEGGHWPRSWRMRGDDQSVLDSLERKGLVCSCPDRRYSLTHDGHVAASYLTGDPSAHRKVDA